LKPLFGLLTDFVPLLGSRRKSWLLLATLMAGIGLVLAGTLDLPAGATGMLLTLLLLPCVGVALSDVVADALMVEKGQPLGLTGRLQSVQWAALYGAGILTGVTGGLLSEHGLQQLGFLICAAFALLGFVVAWRGLDPDPPRPVRGREQLRSTLQALRHGYVLPIAAFLVLLNFNPFSADVLYVHLTSSLGLSESFVGTTYSVGSLAAIAGCIVYGILAPRFSPRALIHLSLVAMIACSLSYLGLSGEKSAVVIAAVVAFAYMFTTLAQLDLAARYCPPLSAGTVFAVFMALSNLSLALASRIGSGWYVSWSSRSGADAAFEALVLIGSAFTAACWLTLLILPARPAGNR
jgi:MFS family permease